MPEEFKAKLANMPDAKRMAVAIYGESIASYRYGLLAEKASSEAHKKIFESMRREELEHQSALEELARKNFPDDDFVLTSKDKELVIVGTRLLELKDEASFHKAMKFLHDTELRTSAFYQAMHELMPAGEIGRILQEMSDECIEHAASLLKIKPA